MAKVQTIIDGKEISTERDRWALDVAREMGIKIPTLCHHYALEPYGGCRMCVVEVTKGKWTWLTTACDLPIREGLSIRTDTPEVRASRKMTLQLLLARAPKAESLRKLAKELGVEKSRFQASDELGKCILCGLCVRICERIIGVSALSFSKRGPQRRVTTPFDKTSKTCIGCNACVAVCPTGHIVSVDKGSLRNIQTWHTELEMIKCTLCNTPYMPAKEFEHIQNRFGRQVQVEKICPNCRRSQTVTRLAEATVKNKTLTVSSNTS
jgi:bidirectional [NiFe] hydrogenase diaphorase subunit